MNQLVSILLPVRNGGRYISRSLQNLSKVSRPEDEILIIEDGSSDDTLEIAEIFAKSDPRVRILDGAGKGLVHALNLGLNAATHEIIARADVDDQYSPQRILSQLKFLEPNVVAVFSDYRFRTDDFKNLGIIPSAITPSATAISLFSGQRTAHPSVIYRKEAVLQVGGYRENDFPAEDLGLWIRLLECGDLATCPEELLQYTISNGSISSLNSRVMLKKKKQLLYELGTSKKWDHRTGGELLKSLEIYRDYNLYFERVLLLYRDLVFAEKYIPPLSVFNENKEFLKKIILGNPRYFQKFGKLAFEKASRKIHRRKV